MKKWIKQLFGFGEIWICYQCDTVNMYGRVHCGLCGKVIE
jgi:hypothetical protein